MHANAETPGKDSQGLLYHDPSGDLYQALRCLNGIPEGSDEIPPHSAIPHEASLDLAGAIDFQKGCYLGQELVARTQHQGLVRKRLMPLVAVADSVADPTHPFHSRPLRASRSQLVPPEFSHAVEHGWIDADLSLASGLVGKPIAVADAALSSLPRSAPSIISVSPCLASAMSMMRLEAVFGATDTNLPELPLAPAPTVGLFPLFRSESRVLLKPIAPFHWIRESPAEEAAFGAASGSPLHMVQWDPIPNVTRPH